MITTHSHQEPRSELKMRCPQIAADGAVPRGALP